MTRETSLFLKRSRLVRLVGSVWLEWFLSKDISIEDENDFWPSGLDRSFNSFDVTNDFLVYKTANFYLSSTSVLLK